MRRFLTLVCLLGLAIPAGVSISGCYRNPAGKYCPETSGYGLLQTAVANITLQPQIAGISLAYGQTTQAQTPSASTCVGTAVSVSSKSYTYGTTNNQLVDISPTGSICAGTWNRNTGGGIADYTYCNPPSPLPTTGGLPYAVAYITATADSVTSNPVAVYVHPQVTSVSLVVPPPPTSSTSSFSCYSQNTVAQLDAQACYSVNGTQYELCAPASVTSSNYSCPVLTPGTKIPTCESSIGTLSFSVGTSSVASLNATTNQITAEQPGTTAITASIAGSGSSAGYFSTCPPASISVALANGATSGTVTQGVPQNLTTTVLDTNGNVITGLALSYQSTNPIDTTVSSGGAITTSFPGVASVNAICQPGVCNPAPTNLTGYNGTGVSIASNNVDLTTPGTASDYAWFGAPGSSQYVISAELSTGTVSSTTGLPYVPNSMVMDRGGNSLYFGSTRELMVYATSSNAITTQAAVPGVVLAVSPNDSQVLINDQARHVFYIYSASGGATVSFPGMANAAQWTPDSQTLYITDNAELNTPASCGTALITGHTDALYVYNANTGWSTYALPPSPLPPAAIPSCTAQPNTAAAMPGPAQTPAVLTPSVGAYLRGDPTVAHTWCPSGTVGNQASILYYPQGDSEAVQSDVLAATLEGHHVLGAEWNSGNTITLSDIAITIPGTTTPAACPITTNTATTPPVQTMLPLAIASTVTQQPVSGVSATAVNQVLTGSTPVPVSGGTGTSLAFITYSGTTAGASLPYYLPATTGAGTLGYVTLMGSANITAPIAGAFSPDNTLFFVSTAGDNMIHYIAIPSSITSSTPLTDSKQISPNLPACSPTLDPNDCTYTGTAGTIVPATVIEVKPRPIT
jgi:trimeric autotransporter adhesin